MFDLYSHQRLGFLIAILVCQRVNSGWLNGERIFPMVSDENSIKMAIYTHKMCKLPMGLMDDLVKTNSFR